MSVMRFDPFRDVDRLAEQMLSGGGGGGSPRSFPIDAYRRGDQFFVHVDLPGVDPKSIELTSEQNVLNISAERRYESKPDDQILILERPQGRFSRQLYLSEGLDSERISASYDQGVLTVTIPIAERAKPRRIQISDTGTETTIEGTASSGRESGAAGASA